MIGSPAAAADARAHARALVIGGSGLVGQALLRALERSGIDTLGTHLSRPANGSMRLDVTDADAVHRCVSEFQPGIVFLAVNSDGGVDFCEQHPDQARALNVDGTKNVASAAAAAGARLVYYSTDYVFDGVSGPYTEDDTPEPLSEYGRVKWQAEELVRELAPAHLIVRTTAVFGWERTSRNLAMQVWDRLSAGQTMRVPSDQWCTPTLADHLAETSIRLAQAGVGGLVNVVGKDLVVRADLAKALARAMALDSDLIVAVSTAELGQVASRPIRGGLKTAKLATLLGTEAMGLSDGLKVLRRHWRADTHITAGGTQQASNEADALKRQIFDGVRKYVALAHGTRSFEPFKSRVPYAGRVFESDEVVSLVDSALDFWLTLGPYGDLFERKMKTFFGAKDFVFVTSGSAANLGAVASMMSRQLDRRLEPGDEVITPAVTFPTTLAPLVIFGLTPVFVDCEVGTYNVRADLLEAAISDRTRAILVPHTLGNPCDMDAIADLVRRHDLLLIEDCCDALGSKFRGRLVGTFGDLATLSFYPAHHITVGEGGGIIVNRAALSRVVRSIRDWGRDCWCAPGESNTCGKRFGWECGSLPAGYDHKYVYSNIGFNLKPTDLQAAIGVVQAERIDDFAARRQRNFSRLYEGLRPFQEHLILPTLDPRATPSWFGFPITVREGVARRALVQWLESANIETRLIFAGNILRQPGYQGIRARISGSLEETDRIMRDAFFLGVYPGLSDEMVDFVVHRVEAFFRSSRQ